MRLWGNMCKGGVHMTKPNQTKAHQTKPNNLGFIHNSHAPELVPRQTVDCFTNSNNIVPFSKQWQTAVRIVIKSQADYQRVVD